jgi:hypothetical protein
LPADARWIQLIAGIAALPLPEILPMTPSPGDIPAWHLRGTVIIACNCDYGCPCNFNGLPSTGKCEGSWSWHVEDGQFGDVPLSGLTVSEAVNWPGAIHHGGGEGIIAIDEAADERQREALRTLLSGRAGGPWKIIAATGCTGPSSYRSRCTWRTSAAACAPATCSAWRWRR